MTVVTKVCTQCTRVGPESSFTILAKGTYVLPVVASKNSLNMSDRGSAQKAYAAFHVYLNGLKYDPEVGFGCPKCPKELGKGEKEDEFNQIEIHIW